MEESSRGRPPNKSGDSAKGGAGVRTPSPGDSSSPGTIPPSDSPTLIDVPRDSDIHPTDAPTIVDFGAGHPADAATMVDLGSGVAPTPGPRPQSPRSQAFFTVQQPILSPGTVLAQRYEILQILGEGGMGAVYKAQDRELNRPVALKVIRPDLAGNKAIIDRFKQELLLAHQVTHKNVIRIYDLGESEGLKFITMEY